MAQKSFYEIVQYKLFPKSYCLDRNSCYLLLKPSQCARCEGLINPLINEMKHLDSNLYFVSIVMARNYSAASEYIQTNGFKFDTVIFDTTNNIPNFINDFNGQLAVPYFFRLDSSGSLINQLALLGLDMSNKALIQNFLEGNHAPKTKCTEFSTKNRSFNSSLKNSKRLIRFQGNISNLQIIDSSKYLVTDTYKNSLIVLQHGKDPVELRPSQFEMKLLVSKDIEPDIYSYLIENKIIKTLYLGAITDDMSGKFLIIASLPNVQLAKENGEYQLSYSNKMAYILKLDANDSVSIDTFIHSNARFPLIHPKTFLTQSGGKIIPLQKGWPCVGVESIDRYEQENNPLNDSFYVESPIAMFYPKYDSIGIPIGKIDPILQKLKTGYYFIDPTFTETEHFVYYNTGFTNYMYRVRKIDGVLQPDKIDTFYVSLNNCLFTFINLELEHKLLLNDSTLYNCLNVKDVDFKNPVSHYFKVAKLLENQCIQLLVQGDVIYILTKSTDNHFQIFKYSITHRKILEIISIPKQLKDDGDISLVKLRLIGKRIQVYSVFVNNKTSNLLEYTVE